MSIKDFTDRVTALKKLMLETNKKSQDYSGYYLNETASLWEEIDRLRTEIELLKEANGKQR